MLADQVQALFGSYFNVRPTLLVRAPGRINLIGEHTDYNGGFVLPAAIDMAVYFAVSARTDRMCHFVAMDLDQTFQIPLDQLSKSTTHPWANYLMGVLAELLKLPESGKMSGINVVFGADLPSGGGLSSSAAIENGLGWAANELFSLGLSRMDLVRLSQRAENNFVGMQCGIMDMFASMMGRASQLVRIDCRDLSYAYYRFDAPHLRLVLCDTSVKHALVDSEYNTRRAQCEEGVRLLRAYDPDIRLLRDVSPALLEAHRSALPPVVYQRCQYVVAEIIRVGLACQALESADFEHLGRLMVETHEGLSRAYEVSCPELDYLVEQAMTLPGVLGARMMGGGFGGCTINLVEADHADAMIATLRARYEARWGRPMPAYVTQPAEGTHTIV
jgi:galactokinase